jgi:large repetitive protein
VRRRTRTALTLAAMASAVTATLASASVASATSYPPPSIHLGCTAAPTNGMLDGSVCVLPFGVTTAPNSYSETIGVTKRGAAGPNVTFAVTTGSLPAGLSMASSGSATAITGNPTKTGTFNFTIKATDANLTSTQAYQITITLQGAPDRLLCDQADNGSFLESGICVLPDAVAGQPYAGHLLTSHKAGGALSVVSGSLPPGLSLPATFTGSGDTIGGAPAQPGVEPTYTFTVQGTGDQGQPLYQVFSITVDPNQPLAIVLPSSGSTLFPGTVGQALALNFFLSGGAAPFTWAVIAGHLPTGMQLQTFSDPRDANDEMAGTPTTAGTFTWTMRVTDYLGQQATQQFTITIES